MSSSASESQSDLGQVTLENEDDKNSNDFPGLYKDLLR